jgi:PKD repeat protein
MFLTGRTIMRKAIVCFLVSLLIISIGFFGIGQELNLNEETIDTINNDYNSLNLFQSKWLSMRSYNNYAPNKMPDFDQRQDSWQKIDAGSNQQVDSTVSGDDILVGVACIATGNNGQLDSSASGDDEVIWYYCGPTATANALWYIDSKHEKNNYPDNNQDTCDLVTKYAGISDDHATGNAPKLIEDLAINFLGTSGKCTTDVKDIASGAWNFINNSKLKGQYKVILYDTNNITMDNLTNWMQFCGIIILRLDTPERGHFVTLQAINNVTNQIIISDPDFDASNPAGSHTQHNDASIVSHDTYTVTPANLRVLNYPEDPCFITHAVNIWKLPMIDSIYFYPHSSMNMEGDGTEIFHIINIEQPTDDCIIFYNLPNGIEYAGGALVNGVPTEPLIEEGILKWYLPGMTPGQLYEVEFQITAINPEELELERQVRVWAYAPSINTELYDDDFGILEIIDNDLPIIESVYHQIVDDTLSIFAAVTDNMKIDQVKAIITDPDQETNEYQMSKSTGDLYKVSLDISSWISGEYTYHVWAKDLAGNEQVSNEKSFTISEELLADANGPYSGRVGEEIQFYGSAVGGSPPYSYEWEFGDEEISYNQNPTHTYTEANTYMITFTVVDATDETSQDSTTAEITENNPPNAPTISGQTSGKAGETYEYTFITIDPDRDDIYLWIEWFEGCPGVYWRGPFESGEAVKLNNTWESRGNYIISAKAKDIYDVVGETGTLEISMPRYKTINIPLFRLFERLLKLFPILYYLL